MQEKIMKLLREVLKEKRLMMDMKGNESPSVSWQESYDFLERYARHLRDKISTQQGFELDDIMNEKRNARLEREEEAREEERKKNAWKKSIGR